MHTTLSVPKMYAELALLNKHWHKFWSKELGTDFFLTQSEFI